MSSHPPAVTLLTRTPRKADPAAACLSQQPIAEPRTLGCFNTTLVRDWSGLRLGDGQGSGVRVMASFPSTSVFFDSGMLNAGRHRTRNACLRGKIERIPPRLLSCAVPCHVFQATSIRCTSASHGKAKSCALGQEATNQGSCHVISLRTHRGERKGCLWRGAALHSPH